MSLGTIILIILVAFIFAIIAIYNKLVALRQKRRQAFSDIDVQLKQRLNLIPQLVETVKGYLSHEKDILENITNARAGIGEAKDNLADRAAAENKLSQAMMKLFAVAENYPDLKASNNFQKLMDELSIIEDKISAARRFFNSATENLNTAIEQFPAVLIASKFGFKQEPYFEVDEAIKITMQSPTEIKF